MDEILLKNRDQLINYHDVSNVKIDASTISYEKTIGEKKLSSLLKIVVLRQGYLAITCVTEKSDFPKYELIFETIFLSTYHYS